MTHTETESKPKIDIDIDIDAAILTLTEDQKKAFDLMLAWWENSQRNSEDRKPFALAGYAGTGKSYTLAIFLGYVLKHYGLVRSLGVAPTNKAVEVLKNFFNRNDIKAEAMTLHSALWIRPGDEFTAKGNRKMQQDQDRGSSKAHYRDYSLVICDESSMVSEELFGFIPKNVPTIFVGDLAQLPPPNTDNKDLQLSPTLQNPDYVLTEVKRYDGDLLNYCTLIRDNLLSRSLPKLETTGNINVYRNFEDWQEKAEYLFNESHNNGDRDLVRVLAHTNAEVTRLNNIMRKAFYSDLGEKLPEYLPGDLLVAKEPIMSVRPKIEWVAGTAYVSGQMEKYVAISTASEVLVSEEGINQGVIEIDEIVPGLFESKLTQLSYQFNLIDHDDLNLPVTVLSAVKEWRDNLTKYVNTSRKFILDLEPGHQAKSKLWKRYYSFLEKYNLTAKGNIIINRLQYGYALTVYQSQGSTFQHTFINLPNCFVVRNIEQRNRLIYTASTRASVAAHFYTKK